MKKVIFFICLLWSVAAMAQEPPYTPMRSNYRFRGVRVDSLLMFPSFTDTSQANTLGLGAITGNIIRIDSVIYVRYSNRWRKQGNGGGTTIDTTSLSNRINDKIENLIRSSDSVYFYKNGTKTFAFKDSVGSVNGFVPYTGATQDVDLGNNGLNAKFIKVTGTAGNGHIDLKHQSGDASGQANSSVLFANSLGYLKWKNDNLYYSTLAMPQTADRIYTYQNKSYVLGDSADIEARVKYSDTASMLTNYSKTNIVNAKLNISDTSAMLSPYAKSWTLNGKVNISDTSNMLSTYQRSVFAVKYSDTAAMLTNYQRMTAFPIATFGAGSGAAGDTSAFTTTALYGSFYNAGSDTIVITSYTAVCQGTSPSVTPTIWYNDSLNATGGATKIVNSPSAVTSTTTGNTVTSLNNTSIPPGNFVWVTTGTVTTKPTYFSLTLIGYRKR